MEYTRFSIWCFPQKACGCYWVWPSLLPTYSGANHKLKGNSDGHHYLSTLQRNFGSTETVPLGRHHQRNLNLVISLWSGKYPQPICIQRWKLFV